MQVQNACIRVIIPGSSLRNYIPWISVHNLSNSYVSLILKSIFLLVPRMPSAFQVTGLLWFVNYCFSLVVRHQPKFVRLLGWIIDIFLCVFSFNYVTKPHSSFHSFPIYQVLPLFPVLHALYGILLNAPLI